MLVPGMDPTPMASGRPGEQSAPALLRRPSIAYGSDDEKDVSNVTGAARELDLPSPSLCLMLADDRGYGPRRISPAARSAARSGCAGHLSRAATARMELLVAQRLWADVDLLYLLM
jgi:hypothetical protein